MLKEAIEQTEKAERNYSIKSFILKYQATEPPPLNRDLLTSPERVVQLFRNVAVEFDGGMGIEKFAVAFLNAQNMMIGFKIFSTGTIDQVAVYPRLIVHSGLMLNAAGLILMHNHPSGHVEPSEEDKALTRRLKEAALLFDIRILDHLIISANGYFSFVEKGLI